MLQLLSLVKWSRMRFQRIPSVTNAHFRYMSKDTKGAKEGGCKEGGSKKETDHTKISGGGKCKKKKQAGSEEEQKNADQKHCEKLIEKREKATKKSNEKGKGEGKGKAPCAHAKAASAPKCPCKPCPTPPPCEGHAKMWQRITLMCALPMIAILSLLVLTGHHDHERPEFKKWGHMYVRTKPFYFGDGLRSRFHNPDVNPLPPDGYEDEIDVEAIGKTPETDKEREERLKEFGKLNKTWKKHNKNREAEAKKRQAAADKEAKKQLQQALKEEKKQQAEEAKELKRLEAEAAKERKRLEAEAEKDRKQQLAFSEKERKRQEAEEKAAAKEAKEMNYEFAKDEREESDIQEDFNSTSSI
ncbi:stress response protein NST1 [Drosophila navojoa]|nr:stress response protein NST1 [Drosophila navojoa]